MGVEAVVGDVGLAANEPLGQRLAPAEDFFIGLEPVQFARQSRRKVFRIGGRRLPHPAHWAAEPIRALATNSAGGEKDALPSAR